MEAHGLVIHLAEYMSAFSEILLKHRATVDKYIGDAIMAFWNAPLPIPDHARVACLAAIECRKKLAELRLEWRRDGKPVFNSRIVVHTGDVVVGNMGSERRLNYTVVGDAVNLASRLDNLAKLYGAPILVSEDTHEEVKDEFEFRKLDRVVVKGKTRSILIHELLGAKGSLSEPARAFVRAYETALEQYFRRDWQAAQSLFKKAYSLKPRDKSCVLLYRRCGLYAQNPPPSSWDGGFVYTNKG
jgi:adenylate cyclase